MGMIKLRSRKVGKFSSNGFLKNIVCLNSDPTIGLGRSVMWKK